MRSQPLVLQHTCFGDDGEATADDPSLFLSRLLATEDDDAEFITVRRPFAVFPLRRSPTQSSHDDATPMARRSAEDVGAADRAGTPSPAETAAAERAGCDATRCISIETFVTDRLVA